MSDKHLGKSGLTRFDKIKKNIQSQIWLGRAGTLKARPTR